MNMINNVISSYQQRIGKYDKQVWEQTIEQEVLKRLRSVPRKTAKVNPDLIDVDLFRGSAFSASKPNHGWVAITRMALLRTLFLPLYFQWWRSCVGVWLIGLLCLLYTLQIITLFIFLGDSGEDKSVASLSSAHVFCPCIMMFILALVHTQMMSAAEFSPQYTRVRPSGKRESCKKHSKNQSSRPSAEQERDSGGSRDTGIDLNLEDVRVRSGSRRLPEARKASPGAAKAKEDRDGVAGSVTGTDLTSDVASAFEKTSDWVRSLSPEQCESVQMTDGFEHLNADPVLPVEDPCQVCGECFQALSNPSDASSSLPAPAGDEICEERGPAPKLESSTVESCGSWNPDEGPLQSLLCPTVSRPDEDNDVILDSSMPCGFHEFGRITETESVANSNGSISDAADSSLISSPTDVNWENEDRLVQVASLNDTDPILENLGVRFRKQSHFPDTQSPEDLPPANRSRSANAKTSSRPFNSPFSAGRGGGSVSSDFVPSEKSPSRRSRLFVSSEEELERGVAFSSCRPSCFRKSGLNQSTKTLDKQPVRNIPETSKIGSRAESRSQPKVKIIDTRQMESTGISSCESDCEDRVIKGKTSPKNIAVEWEDINNTNTEITSPTDTSSAGSSASDLSEKDIMGSGETSQGIQHAASVMNNLASNTDRVSCMIWEPNSVHKVDMTVMDIGWMIIQRVDKMNDTLDYLILGFIFSLLLMCAPVIYRGFHSKDQLENLTYLEIDDYFAVARIGFGHHWRQIVVIVNGMIQRLCLSLMFFFLLSVAERTFKQRLLYAKNFCYLTSSRRAKKYELPHFRLNKVRNIKTWLSLRCFLKKRGPQRTVDSIVSAAFLLSVILLSILCIELLQDYGSFLDHLSNWELVIWCLSIGIYLLRFITLGTKINKKYRNFSVLITEQINLYLHMEQKPHKKDELMVANSVLKLAEDLLKELESPFKISGLSANPFLYNITKVVVLSAFSAVLTELLGFKLKLYKIKIRS